MLEFLTGIMQKIGAAIGAGLIAVGGLVGGQPISYQQNTAIETPVVVEMHAQASSSPEASTEMPIMRQGSPQAEEKSVPTSSLKATVPRAVDVCLNIEGIQTIVPAGFSVLANVCTAIEVKDICPNLVGTQDKVPSGKSFVPRYNECLSEEEIDIKLNAEYDKENAEVAASAKEQQCISAKEKKHSLTYQIEAIYEEYRIKIEAARLNPEGKCCGAVESDLSALSKERSAKVSPLQSDMKKADADIQLYCY